jgi:hypothetical protein
LLDATALDRLAASIGDLSGRVDGTERRLAGAADLAERQAAALSIHQQWLENLDRLSPDFRNALEDGTRSAKVDQILLAVVSAQIEAARATSARRLLLCSPEAPSKPSVGEMENFADKARS